MEELEAKLYNDIAKESVKSGGKSYYNLVGDVMTQASSTL
jgi:hypothetical protein